MPADDLEGLVEEHIQEAEMKKRIEEDFHVKVYPDVWLTDSSANIKRTCERFGQGYRGEQEGCLDERDQIQSVGWKEDAITGIFRRSRFLHHL